MATIGFKRLARNHQIKFRNDVLKVEHGDFETFLTSADALNGLIFYNGFEIFEAAKVRYDIHVKKNDELYANMLRSQHIPFNFFIPLSKDLDYAKAILSIFMGGTIDKVFKILIEHAPDPKEALEDRTSFDVYVEYLHTDGTKAIIGIEVKYTEGAYKLIDGTREANRIADRGSIYYSLTDRIGLYKAGALEELPKDEFRQVWRNQLLGVSMTSKNHSNSPIKHFTSIILYPKGNDHFMNLIPAYKKFLNPGYEDSFMGITYEEFIDAARELTSDKKYLSWLQYLEDRYIVK